MKLIITKNTINFILQQKKDNLLIPFDNIDTKRKVSKLDIDYLICIV